MKPAVTELLTELSKNVQGVGRNIGSKKGHDEEGFDDLADALGLAQETLKICKEIEYEL